jgi:hypothetical protein
MCTVTSLASTSTSNVDAPLQSFKQELHFNANIAETGLAENVHIWRCGCYQQRDVTMGDDRAETVALTCREHWQVSYLSE